MSKKEFKKSKIIKGTFTSHWAEGDVITNATLNLDTLAVESDSADCEGMNHLESEMFTAEDGEEFEICPHCHQYALKSVMVPDDVGNGLHEDKECPEGCTGEECG